MVRIAPLAFEDMTPEQRAHHESSPGGRGNMSRVLAYSPAMAPGFSLAIQAMTKEILVPPLERQICVLAVLYLERGEYELAQHMEVSRIMGIAPEKIEAIADHRFNDPIFNEREQALLCFTRQTVRCVRVDDFAYNAVASFYSPRQIIELIQVIGIYMMLVRVSEIAVIEVDSIVGGDFWKEANKKAGLIKD